MRISATRLTLYALITSIEADIREFIKENCNEDTKNILFNQEVLDKLSKRKKEQLTLDDDTEYIENLIEYIDFGDCINLLNKFKNIFPKSFKPEIEKITNNLEGIIPIRNRVMHSRPLEYDDFPIVEKMIRELNSSFINWQNTLNLYEKIKRDPSSIFGIKIPEFIELKDEERIFNNLPAAEFDDTGFIGRDEDVKMITKRILGNYPVISIIGDGGIGKTALTLKCLYDILDNPNQPFDAIIWVSLKTRTLNNGEFVNIKNTISNTLEMYQEIKNIFIGDNVFSSGSDNIVSEILEYMQEFKTLLVLDNLESINSESLRNFLFNIPEGSKVLTTSRIGIGEFESRHILEGFTEKEQVFYMRRLAKNNRLNDILKMSDRQLNSICKKLYSNPLAIKWLVANLLKGEPIESILTHTENLTYYCMSNVYDKLSDNGKNVLNTLLIYNKDCSDAELAYLLELDSIYHRQALNELMSTNMIRMRSIVVDKEQKSLFSITDFAKEYLVQHCSPSNEIFLKVNKKIKDLKALGQNLSIAVEVNPYSPTSITYQPNTDQIIAAYNLKQALKLSKNNNYIEALKLIERAKDIDPTYYEVYKIAAFMYANLGDYYKADGEYKTAIQCHSDSAPLLYLYAKFKMKYLEEFDEALQIISLAEKIDSENIEIKIQKARLLTFLGKFKESKIIFDDILIKLQLIEGIEKGKTIDLAAENLRRWCEVLFRTDRSEEANELIKIAINTLKEYPLNDKKMLKTVNKIIRTLSYECRNENESVIILDEILNKYGYRILETSSEIKQLRTQIEYVIPNISKRYQLRFSPFIQETIKEKAMKENNESLGYIVERREKFSFIYNKKYSKGLYLYFQDFLGEYSDLKVGEKVKFELSENEKGMCAIKCSKV